MNRKFVFCFTIGDRIVYSFEDTNSLCSRVSSTSYTAQDRSIVQELIKTNRVGNFCSFETGELIFQQIA